MNTGHSYVVPYAGFYSHRFYFSAVARQQRCGKRCQRWGSRLAVIMESKSSAFSIELRNPWNKNRFHCVEQSVCFFLSNAKFIETFFLLNISPVHMENLNYVLFEMTSYISTFCRVKWKTFSTWSPVPEKSGCEHIWKHSKRCIRNTHWL